jgi:hypothetical protein
MFPVAAAWPATLGRVPIDARTPPNNHAIESVSRAAEIIKISSGGG